MPIYEYRCERGHIFDVMQRISEPPLAACRECGAPVQKVLHPVAISFKGSGFYSTDYGNGSRNGDSNGAKKEGGEKAASKKEPAASKKED
ncbi:Putative regulatory protein, FmdB [Rubrobacter xylanophilus DSM 9941]|uniref:Putative regulatory protein, FmdB n=1 Tax=Rubrobacter xylanophilus (strain DSM 9941 / JCM 11954 / NBRC 16129 / PRD-1) TaxID=266117 RepID=Q1AX18_RUBXD|nr:FmdB family zinc ribbon protein [Rubrobacter xylanophilus]ABG04060.1 Putative regulatory protein, FmdB [Rubrobacter xylanophilus DSM 9941]